MTAEIVAEWAPGTFIENLASSPGGDWLVTIPSHHRIDRVDTTGHHEVFAEFEHRPTGIVSDGAGALVITGTIGVPNWRLLRVDEHGHRAVCDLPALVFGNGMERAGERLLAADSARGLLLAIDPLRGESAVWLAHRTLTCPEPDGPMPGANGIAVHGGWVYVSNTGRALLVRAPLAGADPGKELEIEARVRRGWSGCGWAESGGRYRESVPAAGFRCQTGQLTVLRCTVFAIAW